MDRDAEVAGVPLTAVPRRILAAVGAPLMAVLQAPARARQHPRSEEVRSLLDEGWSIRDIAISEQPSRGVVTLMRDGSTRVIADNDLGFTVYAAWLRAATRPSGAT
jgi:hypothetical protein